MDSDDDLQKMIDTFHFRNSNYFQKSASKMAEIKIEDLSCEDQGDFCDNSTLFTEIDIVTSTQTVLVSEELFYRQIEDWMSFTRKDFDCHVNGEPYQAVNFLLNLKSGEFLIRVWCRTVRTGYLFDPNSVSDKIKETFQGHLPCTGIINDDQEQIGRVLFTDFPFSRMMSSTCTFLTKANAEVPENKRLLCESCVYMDENLDNDPMLNHDSNFTTDNLEVKEDMDHVSSGHIADDDIVMGDNDDNYSEGERSLDDNFSQDTVQGSGEEEDAQEEQKCTKCPKSFETKSAFVSHNYEEHLSGRYPCSISTCKFKAFFADDYVQHLNEEHDGETSSLTCRICQESIPLNEFCQHLK